MLNPSALAGEEFEVEGFETVLIEASEFRADEVTTALKVLFDFGDFVLDAVHMVCLVHLPEWGGPCPLQAHSRLFLRKLFTVLGASWC